MGAGGKVCLFAGWVLCVTIQLNRLQYLYLYFDLFSFASRGLEDPSGGGKGNEVALCAGEVAIQTRCRPRRQNKPARYDQREAPSFAGMKFNTPVA